MPFAVATVALISAGMLNPPALPPRAAGPAVPGEARAEQFPRVTTLPSTSRQQDMARYRLESPDAGGSTDLALYVGRRDHGAQFELGALGGGRSDAPGLLHVGIGWDF